MSVVQIARVFRYSRSKGIARLVLLALADVANDEGEITAYARSQKILAAKANCDQGSVRRAIDKLEELGEVAILAVGDGRRSTDYRLTIAEGAHPEGPRSAGPAPAERAPRGGETRAQGAQDAGPISPSSTDAPPSSSVSVEESFEIFWEAYPRRVAKGEARKAWPAAVKKASDGRMGTPAEISHGAALAIIEGAKRYASEVAGSEAKFIAHPASWLRAERWGDEPGANRARSGPSGGQGPRGTVARPAGPEGRVVNL